MISKKWLLKLAMKISGRTQHELAEREFIYTFIFRNKLKALYYAVFK